MRKGGKEHLARETYGAPQKPAAAPAEEREADKSFLVDGVSRGDMPASTVDLSSSTLSVRLDIPEYGYHKIFNAILMKNEKAVLSFTYEED